MPRDTTDLVQCPACGSHQIACLIGIEYDVCCACTRFWQRIPAGEYFMIDGELMPFRKPCDDCAFRGHSPERADPLGWEDLMAKLAAGGEFYCHKGVPISGVGSPQADLPMDFDFPRKESSISIAGQRVSYQSCDKARMRLCRGFLNEFWSPANVRRRHDHLHPQGATAPDPLEHQTTATEKHA